MARVWWSLALLPLAIGCGPIEYLSHSTMQATHAVDEARRAHADSLAPYEFTHAVEYLHKSRELAGFARWQVSVEFAKKAGEMGRVAHELAESRASHAPNVGAGRPGEGRRE